MRGPLVDRRADRVPPLAADRGERPARGPRPGPRLRELWDHFGRPEAWRCFPDVAPALRVLSARRIPIRVGSNFDARLRAVVQASGARALCLDSLVISSEVGFRKPHAAFLPGGLREPRLSPDRVLCVGDDLENDVRGRMPGGLEGTSARPPRPAAGGVAAGAGPDGAGESLKRFEREPARMSEAVDSAERYAWACRKPLTSAMVKDKQGGELAGKPSSVASHPEPAFGGTSW